MAEPIPDFLLFKQFRVCNLPGDGGGRGSGRAYQVDHAAFSHAAAEVTVGGGRADFPFRQHPVAHAQAGPAGGVGDAKTGIHENLDQALVQCLAVDVGGGRRKDGRARRG